MKPSITFLRTITKIPTHIKPYEIPSLSSVTHTDLPNNGFGVKNYYIAKSKQDYWPVYLKIQNTKVTTEIKRIQGDVMQFKEDLLAFNKNFIIKANPTVGYINIKGDVVEKVKAYFDKHMS